MPGQYFSRAAIGLRPPRKVGRYRRRVGVHGHWSVTGKSNDYRVVCRQIQNFHFSKGWNDIAYNMAYDEHGNIYELRGWDATSAAQYGYNSTGVGIVYLGGPALPATQPALEALGWLIGEAKRRGFNSYVWPHSRTSSTACPGPGVKNYIATGSFPDGGTLPSAPVETDNYHSGVFKRGDRGLGVSHVQMVLQKVSPTHPGPRDGDFGGRTEASVKALQSTYGLTADGIFGPATRAVAEDLWHGRLKPTHTKKLPKKPSNKIPGFPGTSKRGSRGRKVRAVQQRLKDRGWKISVDGKFGPQTDSIIRKYQQEAKDEGYYDGAIDGIVGPLTWQALWLKPIS